jgi:phosphoenolpyruvate carboxykinase (ATP)
VQPSSLLATRAIIKGMLNGEVENSECEVLPCFDLAFPKALSGVDNHILDPRKTYSSAAQW